MDVMDLVKRNEKSLRSISQMLQGLNEQDHFWWLMSFKNLDVSGVDASKRIRSFARNLATFISQYY